MRVKCIVSYDGSKFHGFQVQNKERTVQGEIQKALEKINEEERQLYKRLFEINTGKKAQDSLKDKVKGVFQ